MLLSVLLAAATAGLPSDSTMDSVLAFGSSTSYPLGVKACQELLPDQREAFDTALKQWQQGNADKVKAGRAIIAEEGRRTRTDTIRMIRDNQIWLDEQLRAAPKEQRINVCKQLLTDLRGESGPAAGSD